MVNMQNILIGSRLFRMFQQLILAITVAGKYYFALLILQRLIDTPMLSAVCDLHQVGTANWLD